MHSSYSLYACLLLFDFCGFFSALDAGSDTRVPSSSITKKLRAAIDFSSKWSYGNKPLTFYTPLAETCLVNQTQNSIKVTILNKVTVASVTGGPLWNKVYQYHAYLFSWRASECSGNYKFQANVIFFNSHYGSYEKALAHPDGIAIITFPITTSGNYSNPIFNAYGEFFECQMKDHKSVGKINSGVTYTWYVNFPHGGIYHTCTQKYRDEDSGKLTTALFIALPSDPSVNFISSDQFQVFLKMGDSMGKPFGTDTCTSELHTYKGIVVYKLHA